MTLGEAVGERAGEVRWLLVTKAKRNACGGSRLKGRGKGMIRYQR